MGQLLQDLIGVLKNHADNGWHELLGLHGLDIKAADIEKELLEKELPNIRRDLPGFKDFSKEGKHGIEPGNPGRSLLLHAFCSPKVVMDKDGNKLGSFPSTEEIEIIENYVYGVKPPSLQQIQARTKGKPLAIAVFAYAFRPAGETPHMRHSDMCFSRTGVSRVGTEKLEYVDELRGFVPTKAGDDKAIRVLPCRFGAFIATILGPDSKRFNVKRADPDDELRTFLIPVHKLFAGTECIAGLDLDIHLNATLVNEKLRRVHMQFGRLQLDGGWKEPDIDNSPFVFTEGIANLILDKGNGSGFLIPVDQPLVAEANYKGKKLSYIVPEGHGNILSSSLYLPADDDGGGPRHAPEYVHARSILNKVTGKFDDLNDEKDMVTRVENGGYRAQHFIDFTGDGWITAKSKKLATLIPRSIPAYCLVTAPDFFSYADQSDLMDWWMTSVPTRLRKGLWSTPPNTLADIRMAPNISLNAHGAPFRSDDQTVTAIISDFKEDINVEVTEPDPVKAKRHNFLPDGAAGVFAPGWDVSFDRENGVEFLSAYGLGSPFPEDAKLCAALSTFWPSVAPDAARTFEPSPPAFGKLPTISPLTDSEIGALGTGGLPWDGIEGPKIVKEGGDEFIEYNALDFADYVKNALQGKFSLAHTSKIDINEYKARVLSLARCYRALGIKSENFVGPKAVERMNQAKAEWAVLSFKSVTTADNELVQAIQSIPNPNGENLEGSNIYRIEMYKPGLKHVPAGDHKKIRVARKETAIIFVDPDTILLHRNGAWSFGKD